MRFFGGATTAARAQLSASSRIRMAMKRRGLHGSIGRLAGVPLRREDGLDHLLIGERAVLIAVVLDLPGPGSETALAVLVHRAHALDGLVARPLLAGERVDLVECRLRGDQPGTQLLLVVGAGVGDVEEADERRQRQSLNNERREDHAEGEKDDEVALREG